MSFSNKFGMEDVSPYQVHSRREIIGLLKSLHDRNQLVTMQADGGADAVVTSVLEVDEESGIVVVDRAPSNTVNHRLMNCENVSFETMLDNIRILFFSNKVRECLYENLPALYIAIPSSLIRLQRREFYRVPTPVANPVRCTIRIPQDDEAGVAATTVVVTLKDISAGGIAVIDEKKVLDNTIGRIYKDCRIDLPGAPVTANLQVRNSIDLSLSSGKSIRKVGCMFVDLPTPMLASVQRYITKLERERNAKATGLT